MFVDVFLNNKLISCDTIAPFIYELKTKHPRLRISYYCFNGSTYRTIVANQTVYEAIKETGQLILFTDHQDLQRSQSIKARAKF